MLVDSIDVDVNSVARVVVKVALGRHLEYLLVMKRDEVVGSVKSSRVFAAGTIVEMTMMAGRKGEQLFNGVDHALMYGCLEWHDFSVRTVGRNPVTLQIVY